MNCVAVSLETNLLCYRNVRDACLQLFCSYQVNAICKAQENISGTDRCTTLGKSTDDISQETECQCLCSK